MNLNDAIQIAKQAALAANLQVRGPDLLTAATQLMIVQRLDEISEQVACATATARDGRSK